MSSRDDESRNIYKIFSSIYRDESDPLNRLMNLKENNEEAEELILKVLDRANEYVKGNKEIAI